VIGDRVTYWSSDQKIHS